MLQPMRPTDMERFIAAARRIPSRWRQRCPHLPDDDIRVVAELVVEVLAPLAARGVNQEDDT